MSLASPVRPASLRGPALSDIAVGLAAAPHLWQPLLEAPVSARGSTRLIATEVYDAWLLTWPPASQVEPHDHGGAWGAFVAATGELTEVRWTHGLRRVRRLAPGVVSTVDPTTVHDVIATGDETTVSVHVYSPPLTLMRFYDDAAQHVTAVEAIPEEPALLSGPDARRAHPSRT